MIESLEFLRPAWLWLLPLPALLLALRVLSRRREDPWRSVVDAPLLLAQARPGARAPLLPELLLTLGLVFALLVLAGPAWRSEPAPLLRREAPLVLALDLSASVRAADLRPDRLSRARFKLADLVRERSDGQTALLVYAGDAFVVAPLTDDAATLDGLLTALDPSLMPVPGQRPERAIVLAQRLLRDAGLAQGELLLLTDSAGAPARAAAAAAQAAGLRVHVLGLGTPEGAPVPAAGGGFLRDAQGAIRLPRLDEPALQALADAGGGRYARFASDSSDLAALGLLNPVGEAALAVGPAALMRLRDEGPMLLLLLLPLVALAARRGWLLALPLALLVLPLAPAPALAATPAATVSTEVGGLGQFWRDLWQRRERQAWEALQAGEPERAAALARDPDLRGAAEFRAGRAADAAASFAEADDARAHYNRGNALAAQQDWQGALAAWRDAQLREPAHADAAANIEAVEAWLREQPPQPQEGEGDPGESGESGQPDSEPAEGEQGEPGADGQGSPQQAPPEEDPAQQQGSESEPGEDSADEAPQPAADGDAEQEQASAEAFREAMQQALDEAGEEDQRQPLPEPDPAERAEAERQQSLEQLLRRVPDDPGGLLRRKFQLEHQRRQREGDPP
ncbi:MAG: VWA domain-containing protein [Aquimonas sp.]|nr:VWA domain-containing protein [Aquimonas sp.]